MKVLLSAGTYYFLRGKTARLSNTAYALQTGGCEGRCRFCSQSIFNNADKSYLSRVRWYLTELEEVAELISSSFSRFCLQTVMKKGFEDEALKILKAVKTKGKSLTIVPVSYDYLVKFKEAGVDYLGVGLDTVERLWDYVGKPFSFQGYLNFIRRGVEVFGRGHVYVHLIVGLGESDEELISLMKELKEIGAEVALFAFTPVKGTPFENLPRPPLERYRRIQRIRYEIFREEAPNASAYFTSGCPSCDRPYYNESPLDKELYNIPFLRRE